MYGEETVIYADILLLINFALDFLALFITAKITSKHDRAWRLVLGALFGAVYAFTPYVIELSVSLSVVLHLVSAGVICLIAFGKDGFAKFLYTTGVFIVSSALLGGIITAIFSLSSGYSDGSYREMEIGAFLLTVSFSAVIALAYALICKRRMRVKSVAVRLQVQGISSELRLLVDSGNLVTEPFSSLPVIVVASSALPFPLDSPESEAFTADVRVIPYHTSAGRGCFIGFRPERLELIQLAKKPKKLDAYIGIDQSTIGFSGYDGLMPSVLL